MEAATAQPDVSWTGRRLVSREEFAARIVERHRPAFELWQSAASLYRTALEHPRARTAEVEIVLDMFMLQAYNAHTSLSLLAQVGLMEDASTIARRMLEISVQATYIAAESDPIVRQRRAGAFIAFMWRRLPRRIKGILPADVRSHWSTIAVRYGRFVRSKAKRWGPDFRTMFIECGVEQLYTTDYAFLSSVAHGAPETHIMRFSEQSVRAHDDRHVSTILVYGTKYLAIVGEHWNDIFRIVASAEVDALRTSLVNWQRPGQVRRAAT